jgi:N-acetylglucosamine-6-phosphate deacetylase
MDTIVRNVVEWGCATLAEAVRMAATVPAAVAGAGERKGRIAPGYDADLVALTADLGVAATWVRGRRVYSLSDLKRSD